MFCRHNEDEARFCGLAERNSHLFRHNKGAGGGRGKWAGTVTFNGYAGDPCNK